MQAVHILAGVDAFGHYVGIDLLRQRKLDQDAVDPRILIELPDPGQDLVLGQRSTVSLLDVVRG